MWNLDNFVRSCSVMQRSAMYDEFIYYHQHLYDLGHAWSFPVLLKFMLALRLNCGRPMFRLPFGLHVQVSFFVIRLPFAAVDTSTVTWTLEFCNLD
jgi:hypothetical protein